MNQAEAGGSAAWHALRLDPAWMVAKLAAAGADRLREGLVSGGAKLRLAIQIERYTGLNLTGVPTAADPKAREAMTGGLARASSAFLGVPIPVPAARPAPKAEEKPKGDDPREQMLRELTQAAEGAGQESNLRPPGREPGRSTDNHFAPARSRAYRRCAARCAARAGWR